MTGDGVIGETGIEITSRRKEEEKVELWCTRIFHVIHSLFSPSQSVQSSIDMLTAHNKFFIVEDVSQSFTFQRESQSVSVCRGWLDMSCHANGIMPLIP